MISIHKLPTAEAIAAEAARLAADALQRALATQSTAAFVLAGGRLPPVAYDILSTQYATAFEWKKVLFLIGDERCVPLNDPESSWLSAGPLFAAHPEVPADHQLRPASQLPAEATAEAYRKTLLQLPLNQSSLPILDHVWLGMGEDGHTLSLFPNHPSSRPTDELVIAVHNAPKPPPDRISLTYHALSGAHSAVVLISGDNKAATMAHIAQGDHALPIVVASKTIEKAGGQVTWLVDEAALALIPEDQTFSL